ncbi:MAG: C_GCAxxG_C_C family protein [Clostridiales bacterium]|nr:C_GCAxxG_C_C family protein [Clostridiales bacterium]
MKEEVFMLKMKGYCCSQIIMEMGLGKLGKENHELVEAMAGLCDGVKCGKICGVFSAAICLLYLADGKEAEKGLIHEFTDWFEESFGALDCEDLIGQDTMKKTQLCPMIVESSLVKLEELLEWD